MNKKSAFILLIIFLLLTIILLIKNNMDRIYTGKQPFKKLNVKEIIINNISRKEVRIFYKDTNWYVSSERFPGESSTITKVIDSIEKITLEDVISTRSETYSDFEVSADSGTKVELVSVNKGTFTFYVGKNSPDWTKSYFRINGDSAVYLISELNRSMLEKDAFYWKNKNIIKEEREEIEMAEIRFNNKIFSINKSTPAWMKLIDKIKQLKTIEFMEEYDDYKEDLKKPYLNIVLKSVNGVESSYTVIKKDEEYYIKPSALDILYEINSLSVKNIEEYLMKYLKKEDFSK